MQHHFEHQSPQFAIDAEFDRFSNLKHACIRAALLDVYEFVPARVAPDRYTLKCKSKECNWYLYATPIADTDVWRIRKSIQSHSCHDINHLEHSNVDEEFISIEIHSPPIVVSDDELSESDDDSVLPPATRRPSGRPKKRRIRGETEQGREKRVFRCSRCTQAGHSSRTCQAAINEVV